MFTPEIFGKTGNAEDPEKREPLSPLVRIPVTSSTPASPSGRKEGERARPKSSPGTSFNKCACPHAITGWSPPQPLGNQVSH
ncbi:hypothetical protein CEXT_470181 [Caerostris extrusa]|uniref:Uncharacterized protein n=1 Tax=Caerostris extrusa TaxID=172846 RepID=A0AAV4P6Y1_CAEEX|nr:hypothetical protein CEXT_470181 [Caerostris extrusa]